MKSSIKKLSKTQIEIEFELSAEEFENFFKKALGQLKENLQVKGFRKGSVPDSIAEEKIGTENIISEAAGMAIEDSYRRVVQENNLETISRPEIKVLKIGKGNPLVFTAKVYILPEIELPDYKKIASSVERKKVKVEEKEVKDSLAWLQKSRAKFSAKQGSAEKNDFVEMEYESPQIKNASGQEKIKDGFILGEGKFLPGFEEEIIGMKAGEEKEFSLDVPKNHSLRQYGDKIDLKVRVDSVQKVEIPKLDDEFARGLGKFNSLSDLENSVREGITFEKEQAESARVREEILQKISEKTECEVPKILIEREEKQMLENFKKNVLEKLKISWEDYLERVFSRDKKEDKDAKLSREEKIKKQEKKIMDSFRPQAEGNIKKLLILREIGKKEKIEASDEEVTEEINKLLLNYGSPEEARKNIDLEELKEYTKEKIKNEKIFSFLEDLVKKSESKN